MQGFERLFKFLKISKCPFLIKRFINLKSIIKNKHPGDSNVCIIVWCGVDVYHRVALMCIRV